MTSHAYINVAKKRIDVVDVVSFDIFDTLLLRPYLSPRDLFLHIEKEKNLDGFQVARRAAELSARKLKPELEDITFDDIYEQIAEKYKVAKQLELDWECQVLTANPEMKIIWDYAKQCGKKIIIISDMYLSTEFLIHVLRKNGFGDFDHIYVSGAFAKTKKKGSLFRYVLDDLKLDPKQIIHLGDNKKGDFKVPKRLGINCLLYTQVIEQFLKHDYRANLFCQNSEKKLGSSILIALLSWKWQKTQLKLISSEYWKSLGYAFAAPIAYAYSRWIEQTSNLLKIEELIFVARDGYLLQKVFKSFNQKLESKYIYTPRLSNLVSRLDYDPMNIEQIKAIIDYFSQKYEIFKSLDGFDRLDIRTQGHHFIQKYRSTFEQYAKFEFETYQKYINHHISADKKLAMIDTKTIAFTSQKLLENILQRPVIGFYWSTVIKDKYNGFNYIEFLKNNRPIYDLKIFSHNWKFIELLLSSPEYPIKGIDQQGMPIYEKNPSSDATQLKHNFHQIDSGVDEFLQDISYLFDNKNLFIDGSDLIDWVNLFCNYPTKEDINNMSKIKLATDVSHQTYEPLFSSEIGLKDLMNSPKKSLAILKNSMWKTPTQNLVLNVIKPIKIKKQKNGVLKISIFPHLQHQYLVFLVKLLKSAQLKLILGKFGKD